MKRSTLRRIVPFAVLAIVLVGAIVAALVLNQNPTPARQPAATAVASSTTIAVVATTASAAPPSPVAATETVQAAIPAGSFRNPVFQSDFPDPHVINVKGVFYAYATNASGRNIQVARSNDLINWELQGDALPALPTWAKLGGSLVWAPEVIPVGDKYVMYYTARDKQSNKQCIGVAISDQPDSRFKDTNTKPFICQDAEGGSIDPHPYQEGDKLYLYWKNDGNCCSQATWLYVQELSADGLTLSGNPTQLVRNDKAWEGRVVEAPTMVKHEGNYYLFFSGNDYAGLEYAVGYATCKSVVGPCEDAPENPILKSVTSKPPVVGPGHQTIVQVGDETWLVYHVWEVNSAGFKGSRRFMWIDRVIWKDGKPQVQGPNAQAQPAPKIKP